MTVNQLLYPVSDPRQGTRVWSLIDQCTVHHIPACLIGPEAVFGGVRGHSYQRVGLNVQMIKPHLNVDPKVNLHQLPKPGVGHPPSTAVALVLQPRGGRDSGAYTRALFSST
jgi:hypothetical protein